MDAKELFWHHTFQSMKFCKVCISNLSQVLKRMMGTTIFQVQYLQPFALMFESYRASLVHSYKEDDSQQALCKE